MRESTFALHCRSPAHNRPQQRRRQSGSEPASEDSLFPSFQRPTKKSANKSAPSGRPATTMSFGRGFAWSLLSFFFFFLATENVEASSTAVDRLTGWLALLSLVCCSPPGLYDLFDANDIAIHHRQEQLPSGSIVSCLLGNVGTAAEKERNSVADSDAFATRRFLFFVPSFDLLRKKGSIGVIYR